MSQDEPASAPPDRRHLPHETGVYIMRDGAGEILYIGKAIDLAKRVAQYFNPNKEDAKNQALAPLVRRIDYVLCQSEREALLLERRLIHENQPFFNVMWKDGKTYPYVKISLGEDFPRIFTTRRKVRDGGAYFGPYPRVAPVKSLLRYLWKRRLFPLRPCAYDFSEKKPLDPKKIKGCLYYHTRECPAPCAGRVSTADYRRIAARAALFFRGRYRELGAAFDREMKAASDALDYERAAQLRDARLALGLMGERVRVRAVEADDVGGHVAATRAVTDLQKALGLAAPPVHVECFDISHFQGRQTVASMVCFVGARPHRDHYRKFKIRDVAGIDDFKSMREAVYRRYRRLRDAGERLPDLVLIDGGKGQLGAAQDALKALGLKLPLASLAKRIEEVFVPGRAEAILLPFGGPALSLLQRLRDEAHRFGVTYHRSLRGKALFEG
ncbi:MAG: excinuclease ABC subunit UvrC [Elusimicrobia bacterium]|nr:excinuclease ABC subunit UvrC [Elusimicrobiota bacterium]